MKRLIILTGLMFAMNFAFSQNPVTSSMTFVDAGGGNHYVVDTTSYDDNSIVISVFATQDSANLVADIVADSLSSSSNYISKSNSYATYSSRISTLQSSKTTDSISKEYWFLRNQEFRRMLDSIAAN